MCAGCYRVSRLRTEAFDSTVAADAVSLEAFARQLRTPAIDLGVYLQIKNPTEKTLKEQDEVWDKAWQTVDVEIPKLRVAIEAEFRKLLGVGAG